MERIPNQAEIQLKRPKKQAWFRQEMLTREWYGKDIVA
jgi:hypothetical protein